MLWSIFHKHVWYLTHYRLGSIVDSRVKSRDRAVIRHRRLSQVIVHRGPSYRDLMLEFLISFEFRISYNVWDNPLTIHFQLRGQEYHLNYTDLALLMGISTPEYTVIEEYRYLISSPPLGEGQRTQWRRLSDCGLLFRPSLTASTTLKSPALLVIHVLLSGTITGWIRYTNTITSAEFKYLLNMGDRTPYHLGFVIADSFHHQATATRGHTIFLWPYINWLIRGMGLLGDMDHVPTVGRYNLISLRRMHWMFLLSS